VSVLKSIFSHRLVARCLSLSNLMPFVTSSPVSLFDIYTLVYLCLLTALKPKWLLTLVEECKLWVFENRLLRRIFGPKRYEVTREWRRLHNKELYALCSSPDIIRVIKSR
jgi:hypothetical protein